jgi:hypothetical protein
MPVIRQSTKLVQTIYTREIGDSGAVARTFAPRRSANLISLPREMFTPWDVKLSHRGRFGYLIGVQS